MTPVEIVTPMYNASATLDETIRSVREQTLEAWRWWMLDDGSSDDTLAIARRHAREDSRIEVLAAGRIGHIGTLRNRGVEKVSAPLVAFLDADDLWQPSFLEVMTERARATAAAVTHCAATHLAGEREVEVAPRFHGPGVVDPPEMLRYLAGINPIYSPSTVLRVEVLRTYGGFSEHPDHRSTLDFDLWLRLARRERFAYEPRALLRYRISPLGLSQNPANRVQNTRGQMLSLESALASGDTLPSELTALLRQRLGRAKSELGRALLEQPRSDLQRARRWLREAQADGFMDHRLRALLMASRLGMWAPKLLARLLRLRSRAVLSLHRWMAPKPVRTHS